MRASSVGFRLGVTVATAGVLSWSLLAASAATVFAATASAATVAPAKAQPTNSFLYGVGCFSKTNCTSVGSWTYQSQPQESRTLAEHWNGTKWSIATTPEPAGTTIARLNGVACPSAKMCVAVGAAYEGPAAADTVPVIESWNGSKWTLDKVKEPAGGSDGYLEGVACGSATQCLAVGYFVNGSSATQNLAELWNGSKWTASAPAGSSKSLNYLNAVACPGKNSCVAVGQYQNQASLNVAFTDRWNGSKWAPQATPSPAGDITMLRGVACAGASHCLSAGNLLDTAASVRTMDTLAERWNGSKWTLSTPVNPSPAFEPSNNLNSISCPSTTLCMAVGDDDNSSSASVTLAEKWNGSKWIVGSTPNSATATVGNHLLGVACTSATRCLAVGYSQSNPSNTGYATISEQWNGTKWTLVPTA
jgi:hypothetical protein